MTSIQWPWILWGNRPGDFWRLVLFSASAHSESSNGMQGNGLKLRWGGLDWISVRIYSWKGRLWIGTGCPGRLELPSMEVFKRTGCLGTWFCGGLGSARFLKGPFQSKWSYDSSWNVKKKKNQICQNLHEVTKVVTLLWDVMGNNCSASRCLHTVTLIYLVWCCISQEYIQNAHGK